MQKKLWAYQYEEVADPWAICAVLTYPRGSPEKKKVALDVYSELIPNEHRLLRLESKSYDSAEEISDDLTDLIACFDELSERDQVQIENFSKTILVFEE